MDERLKGYRDAWKAARKIVAAIMENMVSEMNADHELFSIPGNDDEIDTALEFVHIPVAELERLSYKQRYDVIVHVNGKIHTVLNFHFFEKRLYINTSYLEDTMKKIRTYSGVSAHYYSRVSFNPEGDPKRIARRIIKAVIPSSIEDRRKTAHDIAEYELNALAEIKLREELESMGLQRSTNDSSALEGSYDLPGQVNNYKFTTGTVKTYNGRIQHLELRSMPDKHADRIALIYFMAHGKSIGGK